MTQKRENVVEKKELKLDTKSHVDYEIKIYSKEFSKSKEHMWSFTLSTELNDH